MSKSRKRRPKPSNQRRTSQHRIDPLRGMGAEEFRRNIAALQATDDAERRGDAVAALAMMKHHSSVPGFWRPWRVRALCQMAMFGSMLPRWATSRWILAQAMQQLGHAPDGPEGRRHHRALEKAIELRGGRANLPGTDPTDALCKVMDHDWVYRQLHLYEFGGLRHFLRVVATADLVSGADRIHEWVAAPMGGYRLVTSDAATVTWRDLALDDTVVTANIGSASLVVSGECVVGRLVPIEGGVMFEGAPLIVPEDLAVRVARDPAGWFEALRSTPRAVRASEFFAAGDGSGLLSDVPVVIWMNALCEIDDRLDSTSVPTAVQCAQASLTLARIMLDRPEPREGDDVDPWSCLAAALLEPSVAGALAKLVVPADREVLIRLGELLAEPAASWCRELANSLAQVA